MRKPGKREIGSPPAETRVVNTQSVFTTFVSSVDLSFFLSLSLSLSLSFSVRVCASLE